jgi:hypothetical protein
MSEIKIALRSSRARTTVPSRIRRTIGPAPNKGGCQASQSLSPRPAHRVLADCPAEQRHQRATHAPAIGAGEIGARGKRAPLIAAQRPAIHSTIPPSGLVGRARGTAISIGPNVCDRARRMAVARNAGSFSSSATRPYQRSVEFAASSSITDAIKRSPRSPTGLTDYQKDQQPIRSQAVKESGFVVLVVMAWPSVRRFVG